MLFFCRLITRKLWNANIVHAKFISAQLDGTDLSGAQLVGSDLSSVNLKNAELNHAIFKDVILNGTNFSGATCHGTVFSGLDLSNVIGLEDIIHTGPSTVGIDTLYLSKGNIPEIFLPGCGVPEEMIRYIPSLVGSEKASDYYSSFISYNANDKDFTERLYSRMRDKEMRIWYAPEDLEGGKKLYDQIDRAILVHDKLLIVLSENSMHSEWVRTEILKAFRQEKNEGKRKLFPISLCSFEKLRQWKCFDTDTGRDLGEELRSYFIPDFSNWENHDSFENEFEKLLKAMKEE